MHNVAIKAFKTPKRDVNGNFVTGGAFPSLQVARIVPEEHSVTFIEPKTRISGGRNKREEDTMPSDQVKEGSLAFNSVGEVT